MTFGQELFSAPYKERIQKVLPTLFNMVELENRRGKKLGMEVGTARERVLIALFMYVYGDDSVEFPPSPMPELDVKVNSHPISIKTKSSKGFSGVKLVWTVDWASVDKFVSNYKPCSDMLFINIIWGGQGGFFLIPLAVQKEVLSRLGKERFMKIPPRGTNPRGIELSSEAMRLMQAHKMTQNINIAWHRDKSLLVERALYRRWIELWNAL